MRICIFSRTFAPNVGGLERMAQMLASQFARHGHDATVVTDVLEHCLLDTQAQFKIIRTKSSSGRLAAFRRSDIIMFMNMSLVGLGPAIGSGKRILATHHGVYEDSGAKGKLAAAMKRIVARFTTNISVSQFVANKLGAPSHVILNAYDDDQFPMCDDPDRELDFVFCGRLVSDKGASLLLDAFANVAQSDTKTNLTIIGEGPEMPRLVQKARRLGVAGQVRFTGSLEGRALVQELTRHACMVVPSVWEEPFGIVALEAIACCGRVIVTNRGGLPEAVGTCATVVEPTVEALADEMRKSAVARRAGMPDPSVASPACRQRHLARHTASGVAQQYLAVCNAP
jgi:glycogen synthase